MKRSKIFLGITTAILAVTGVAATKHYIPSVTRFYITINGTYCKAQTATCTNGGTIQCFHTVINQFGIITKYPLYTKGTEGLFPSGTRCTSPLKYVSIQNQ